MIAHPALKPHRHRPSQERKAVRAPIPRAWPDSTIVLIANGPSLSKPQIGSAYQSWIERRVRVLGCNDAYRIAPWIDGLYACDLKWWTHHIEPVRDLHMAMLFTQDAQAADQYGLWHIPSRCQTGLSADSGYIHTGQGGAHSGFQLLNLAVHLGAKRIILIGYDCGTPDMQRKHWFGNHPPPLDMNPFYSTWAAPYRDAAPQLFKLGVEVINCTPGSAIDCFPRSRIGAVLGT